jgi:hypothetical protein
MAVLRDNTPANFSAALERARVWCDKNQNKNKIITVNSWNEWTEGSFLEPEREFGYEYLEAMRQVFEK